MIQSVATVGSAAHICLLPGVQVQQSDKEKFEKARIIYHKGAAFGDERMVFVPGMKGHRWVSNKNAFFKTAVRHIIAWMDEAAASPQAKDVALTVVRR